MPLHVQLRPPATPDPHSFHFFPPGQAELTLHWRVRGDEERRSPELGWSDQGRGGWEIGAWPTFERLLREGCANGRLWPAA